MGSILGFSSRPIAIDDDSTDDRVSGCRNVEVVGDRCVCRGRKTWGECENDDMILHGLQPKWAVFRDMWKGFIHGANI